MIAIDNSWASIVSYCRFLVKIRHERETGALFLPHPTWGAAVAAPQVTPRPRQKSPVLPGIEPANLPLDTYPVPRLS